MKLLFTQRKLDGFGGTELITFELARAMQARGHEVAVFCPRPGKLTGIFAANGIHCHSSIDDLQWRPDVVHCHHHLPAMAALAGLPDTPAIYFCHGVRPWVERPPRHDNIKHYVAVSGKMAALLATQYDLAEARISVLPNFVDTQRFSRVRTPVAKPLRRAVLFGQNGFSIDEQDALERACNAHGIALEKIGGLYGKHNPNPELDLPDHDLAFAIGRCAVEAMASGCATIPIVPALAGELITAANLDDWANCNFSPRYYTTSEQVNAAWLGRQLDAYEPDDAAAVTARIRSDFSVDRTVERLQQLYRSAMSAGGTPRDDASIVRYIESLARDADEVWEEGQEARIEKRRQQRRAELLDAALAKADMRTRTLVDCLLSMNDVVPDRETPDWKLAITASGLFDRNWYLENNPEVVAQQLDPLEHYLAHGAEMGLEPAAGFNSEGFYRANPKLRSLGVTPLEHLARLVAAFAPPEKIEETQAVFDGP